MSRSTTEGLPDSLTRRYAAPEVLANEPRNRSADVFSLGCVYLEMLAALGTGPGDLCPKEISFSDSLAEVRGALKRW